MIAKMRKERERERQTFDLKLRGARELTSCQFSCAASPVCVVPRRTKRAREEAIATSVEQEEEEEDEREEEVGGGGALWRRWRRRVRSVQRAERT